MESCVIGALGFVLELEIAAPKSLDEADICEELLNAKPEND
jgi:hypothetical protein